MDQQKVSNRSLDVLNHDLRSKIYELIKVKDHSTIDISKRLKENRVSLYHHLQMLEKVGLIESYYNNERMKCFRLPLTNRTNSQLNNQTNQNSTYQVIAINPTTKNSPKIMDQVQELLQIAGESFLENAEIIQIQILYQSSE